MPNMSESDANLLPFQREWLRQFDAYAERNPGENIAMFRELASSASDAAERTRVLGHLTGSAWLVSADGARVLLTHHKKLGRWLQLGGHADGDVELARTALREAEEESGLRDLEVEAEIFDLDRHRIPARGSEPEHWHYDVRFVVHARRGEEFALSDESHALAWRNVHEVLQDASADASMRRMAQKWLARTM